MSDAFGQVLGLISCCFDLMFMALYRKVVLLESKSSGIQFHSNRLAWCCDSCKFKMLPCMCERACQLMLSFRRDVQLFNDIGGGILSQAVALPSILIARGAIA